MGYMNLQALACYFPSDMCKGIADPVDISEVLPPRRLSGSG